MNTDMTEAPLTCDCLEDPTSLWDRRICLTEVSKNVRGRLNLMRHELQTCADPACDTLKTDHTLRLQVQTWACDAPPSDPALDGVFFSRQLVTAYADDVGAPRGHHTGRFEWIGQGVVVKGSMSGMTNVGTHREPPFSPCQACDEAGWMEGRLCGRIVESEHPELPVGYVVTSVYRFQLDTTELLANRPRLRGVFEGVLVAPCHEHTAGATPAT